MDLRRIIQAQSRAVSMALDKERFRREFFKKAVLTYPPRSATVAISSACNNRCVFCAYHSDDARNGTSNVYGLNYRTSLEDFKRMVDMCYEGRVPKVHICATGEAFLHRDIIQIIDYTIEVYGFTSLQTNFFKPLFEKRHYLDEIIQRADSISHITTDILSGDPKVHETLKRGSCYEDVLSSMEYINKYSNIHFEVHYIITKHNYKHIDSLINDLASRKINCHIAIVNLYPHYFNDFTAVDSLYTSKDVEITAALQRAKELGEQRGIKVSIPLPADAGKGICGSFWSRFQIWPVKGVDEKRYGENVIIGGCNAVVRGNLNSLGYLFDYKNVMELWNNEHFVKIRKNLLAGIYPDQECRFCQSYRGK
jgi:MoaA/NifB/PqqE/SkfB family radical SAM enzyme